MTELGPPWPPAPIRTERLLSMRLAAKLGFTQTERFHAYGTEQRFRTRHPAAP
ncbi:hypothetical protein [Streptomyces sp. CAU 1734]|uniref:hypothetical protein n=1 Tax=Streptomyces sp. CAU 1734 TaxID=3140360 RepID=UPI003260B7CC